VVLAWRWLPDMRSPKFVTLRVFIDPDSFTEQNIIGVEVYGDSLPPDPEP
jgi:hypothetical protein